MPITRAKATGLLNQREMALYDDSRANALRQLDAKALTARVSRAREARNRARDLVQRQKLASRSSTGSKRGASGQANQRSKDKVEILADILSRFEAQLKDVGKPDKAATKKTVTKKKAVNKTAKTAKKTTKKAVSKTAASKAAVTPAKKTTVGKTTSAKPAKKATALKAAPKPAAKKTRKSSAKAAPRKLTPAQALKRTRKLLETKQAEAKAPKPWQSIGGHQADSGRPGFQSDSAASRAEQLHAGETRLPAIQGSISTRDRINQGKRDHRGQGED